MHLYEKGGFFKEHQDTLHAANHYATIVIRLPTGNQGGQLAILSETPDGSPEWIETECYYSSFGYAIFLTDIKHQVLPASNHLQSFWRFVTIAQQDWTANEQFALASLLEYHCVPFLFMHRHRDYDLSHFLG